MAASPLGGLNLYTANQASGDVTINALAQSLERLTQISVVSGIGTNNNTPPTTPAAGSAYLVGTSGTGVWSSHSNQIAFYIAGGSSTPPPEVFITVWRGMLVEDQTNGIVYRRGSSTWIEQLIQKGIALYNPTATENITMFHATRACTIRRLQAVVRGTGSPSVTIDVRHGTDRSAAGTALLSGSTLAITNTTTPQLVTSFNDATLAAGEWMWLTTTAIGGTTRTELFVDVEFSEDP